MLAPCPSEEEDVGAAVLDFANDIGILAGDEAIVAVNKLHIGAPRTFQRGVAGRCQAEVVLTKELEGFTVGGKKRGNGRGGTVVHDDDFALFTPKRQRENALNAIREHFPRLVVAGDDEADQRARRIFHRSLLMKHNPLIPNSFNNMTLIFKRSGKWAIGRLRAFGRMGGMPVRRQTSSCMFTTWR